MIIPVRVPAGAMPVLASERRMTILPGHPLYDELCPVCDGLLGEATAVLVFAGIESESRKPGGFTTGAAVAVHAFCAGVPEEKPVAPPRTVTFDVSDSDTLHVLATALEDYEAKERDMAALGDASESRERWANLARVMRKVAEAAAG
jgi:hypothetical protein